MLSAATVALRSGTVGLLAGAIQQDLLFVSMDRASIQDRAGTLSA
jgi:hypothetical protein